MHRMQGLRWFLLITAVASTSGGVPKGFDLKLLQQVLTGSDRNDAVSPFLISSMMSQVWLATRGPTRDEIFAALGANSSFIAAYKSAIEYLASGKNTSSTTSAVFSRMYVRSGYIVRPEFSKSLVENFRASVATFSDPDQGANTINKAVANTTRGRIRNIITSDCLVYANYVLVSALYFKTTWKYAFNPAKPANFLTEYGEKSVNMMTLDSTRLFYASWRHYDAVSLPYKDENYRMILIRSLDRMMSGTMALLELLDTLDIDRILAEMYPTKVVVRMPRFTIEEKYSLRNALYGLGIRKVFEGDADFSGLSDKWGGLFIGDVIHKVYMDVNENGTEAAGAGATSLRRTVSMITQFTLDRPFIAVVYNALHKISLFTAYVGSP